jgi:HEAT repeat protein
VRLSLPAEAKRWLAATGSLVAAVLIIPWVLLDAPLVAADARSEYLIRLLQGSNQFRVRAQAAISLGGVENAPDVGDALIGALRDEHPAVRAAAANSLGRLSDPRALPALRKLDGDPEAPVRVAARAAVTKLESDARRGGSRQEGTTQPGGPPRYYVAVGKPGSRSPAVSDEDLERAQQILRERLGEIDGVVVATAVESPTAVRNLLRNRKLKGFYIDSSVVAIENKPGGGVRASVSVILATYPDRAMRAIMQGAATAIGGGDVKSQAMAGALKSALNQLPQALSRE